MVRDPLTPDLRHQRIVEIVRREGGASVSTLATAVQVSPVTIHRDLDRLAREGLVERVRGGARATDAPRRTGTDWEKRLGQSPAEKTAIAAVAARYVDDGSTIFLDSSTTCLALSRELDRNPPKALTLVTNSPAIAYEQSASAIHVIVTPGEVDSNLRLIGGRWTVQFLQKLHFASVFVSGVGMTLDSGLTTGQRGIADTVRAALARAQRRVALVDAAKFGNSALMTLGQVHKFDAVITDSRLPGAVEQEYRDAGVRLEVVGEPAEALGSHGDGAA